MEENKKNELNDEELDDVNGGLFIVNKLFGNKNTKSGKKKFVERNIKKRFLITKIIIQKNTRNFLK